MISEPGFRSEQLTCGEAWAVLEPTLARPERRDLFVALLDRLDGLERERRRGGRW